MRSERRHYAPLEETVIELIGTSNTGIVTSLELRHYLPRITQQEVFQMTRTINAKSPFVTRRIVSDFRNEWCGIGILEGRPSKSMNWKAEFAEKLDTQILAQIHHMPQQWISHGDFSFSFPSIDTAPFPPLFPIFIKDKHKPDGEEQGLMLRKPQYEFIQSLFKHRGYIDERLAHEFLNDSTGFYELVKNMNIRFNGLLGTKSLIDHIHPTGYGIFGEQQRRQNFLRGCLPEYLHLGRIMREADSCQARRITEGVSQPLQMVLLSTHELQSMLRMPTFKIHKSLPYTFMLFRVDNFSRDHAMLIEISPAEYNTLSLFQGSLFCSIEHLSRAEKKLAHSSFKNLLQRINDSGYDILHYNYFAETAFPEELINNHFVLPVPNNFLSRV